MSVGYKPEVVSLVVSRLAPNAAQVIECSHRHIFVAGCPAAALGVTTLAIDGGLELPVPFVGFKLSACEGEAFKRVAVRNPAVGGTLTLVFANDEAVPFGASSPAPGSGLWETDLVWWPVTANAVHTSAFVTDATHRFGGQPIANAWGGNLGVATSRMEVYRSRLSGTFSCGGGAVSARVAQGFSAYPLLQRNGIAAGAKPPDHARAFIWTFPLAWNSDLANTDESGVVVQLWDVSAGGWIRAGNNGIGIVRNGAGAWRFVSKRFSGVGSYQDSLALTWPASVLDYVTVDLVILAANGDRDARFQLWLDGVSVLERRWEDGALPLFGDSGVPPNAGRFFPHVRAGDGGVGGVLHLAPARYRAGRYDPSGAEVT